MLCPDCKTKVPAKYTYCPKCGASIPLYRIGSRSISRFVPALCGLLAVGGLGTVAVMSGIRTRNAIPRTTAAAEKPAAEAPAPATPDAPVISPDEKNDPVPAAVFLPEDSMLPLDSAVHAEHIASLGKDSARHSGDVNGDGCVDVIDAQLILADYTLRLGGSGGILDSEQRVNGAVATDDGLPSAADAQLILRYYAACLSDPSLRAISVQDWNSEQDTI